MRKYLRIYFRFCISFYTFLIKNGEKQRASRWAALGSNIYQHFNVMKKAKL
jgi:hypothetical protein